MLALVQRLKFATQIGIDSQRLYWAMAAVGIALLPHMAQVPLWIPLLIVVVATWRIAIEICVWRLPPRWLRVAIAFTAITSVAASFRTLNGLEAGTALLTLMSGIKLLESRGLRDCTMLIFIGYVLLFAALLYDQSLVRLPYILAASGVLTAALLRLHQSSQPMRARVALRTTGAMVLQATPMAVLLFLFFPRLPGHLWALPTRSSSASGLSDEMTPGNISSLSLSSEPAFRVKFATPLPPQAERYWRGPVLHDFDGRRWRRVSIGAAPRQEVVGIGATYQYRITIEPTQRSWIFALDAPSRWQGDAFQLYDLQLIARQPISTLTSFELQSNTQYRTSLRLPKIMEALDTRLPGNANPRSRAFAQRLRSTTNTDAEYINAILNKFRREEFFYTLTPDLLGDDSVDDFLFTTRRGFCEHYASAFTLLMRAAGIPARVVTGYQGGEYNSLGEYLLVRQSDAHAWSEVWLEDRGWVRVDPTAAVAPERIERNLDAAIRDSESVPGRFLRQSQLLSRIRSTWDAVNNFWNDRIVQYNELKQRSLMALLGVDDGDWRKLGIAFLAMLVLFFTGLTTYLAWRYRARQRDPVVGLYQALCRRLGRVQLQRHDHEGPVDYLGRVASARPELAKAISEIETLYLELRYGPAATTDELRRFKRLVNQLTV